MRVGDLWFGIKAEWDEFQAEIAKRGPKAGQQLGDGVGKGFNVGKVAVGLFGTAAAGAFALATKGAAELDNAQAKLQATTGMTAEEAKKAGEAINAMAGRNLQSIEEIGDVLGKTITDLGLTGEAANQTSEQFLRFATATGQDASDAVSSFDDILDGYGKTAADIPAIMDQLVASHQKYGGSIADNQTALAGMAPQLRALNLTMDDGIEILNMFAASGLDASTAQKSLNAAITNLPRGTSLDEFVAELASIEDPTKRAQRAMEVFGTKAGVGLANAIKPGMDSLDDFGITAQEAASATDRAADAIEGTLQNQIQLALKNLGSVATDVLGKGGPLITGMASLTSLGATFGLDKVFDKILPKFKELGEQAGDALIEGADVAVGALGTIVGNLTGNLIQVMATSWDRVAAWASKGVTGSVIAKAGAAAGAVYGLASVAAARLVEFVSDLWSKVGGDAAILAIASRAGSSAGAAFLTGFAGALAGVAILKPIADDIFKAINPNGWDNPIARMREIDAARAAGREQGTTYMAAINAATREGRGTESGFAVPVPGFPTEGELSRWAQSYAQRVHQAQLAAIDDRSLSDWARSFALAQFQNLGRSMRSEAQRSPADWAQSFAARQNAAAREAMTPGAAQLGVDFEGEYAKGLGRGARAGNIAAAFDVLKQALEDANSGNRARALVLGQDWIDTFNRGVKSRDPAVRATTLTTGATALAGLWQGTISNDEAKRIAQIATGLYKDGWSQAEVEEATGLGEDALRKLRAVPGFNQAGRDQTEKVGAGMTAATPTVTGAAAGVINAAQRRIDTMELDAPTPRVPSLVSNLAGPLGYAQSFYNRNPVYLTTRVRVPTIHVPGGGRAAGGPVEAGTPYVVGEKRAELFVPNVDGMILPSVPESYYAADIGGRLAASRSSMASAGGGETRFVNLNVTLSSPYPLSPGQGQALADEITPHVWRHLERAGKVSDG